MNPVCNPIPTILIVDDHPANLSVLSDALDEAGWEVWVAKSGKVALERVKYALPHLILLDVMMPEMDGFETCRRLKANPDTREVPVIFMTALSDTANKVAGFEAGAVDYITKPFQQAEVLSRVKLHLQLSDLSRKLEDKNHLLEEKLIEVNNANKQLQKIQLKLIQSEKLSSIGQMVAGITHEINNPVNFIYGNLLHANEYTQELLEILHLYQEEYPNPSEQIKAHLEEADLHFLKDDLLKLFESMNMGAKRIHEIIKSMRVFSRMDELNMKGVNIHEGIDSTLTILNYRLKPKPRHPGIEVIKNYGELPLVECYAGKVNQVFMNILVNAIDALEESNQERSWEEIAAKPSRIEITTQKVGDDWVAIHIADNGPGMSEAVQEKLFKSFFTTKPPGKGTGLGLSISQQIIVEQHGGNIYCQSTPNTGTEFVIKIPIQQQSAMIKAAKIPAI
ncbi:sensor histidine kinase [Nodularia chucula]|uniref:sensor histidine kinase n=1 Tax=Nodularia chucula TaxID=3093667 RepID=UPI0039C63CAE